MVELRVAQNGDEFAQRESRQPFLRTTDERCPRCSAVLVVTDRIKLCRGCGHLTAWRQCRCGATAEVPHVGGAPVERWLRLRVHAWTCDRCSARCAHLAVNGLADVTALRIEPMPLADAPGGGE
jgi:hypothetical protein